MTELWTVAQAAAHWGVSESRARAILAQRKIQRVSGYPADQIKDVILRQGARTDLADRGGSTDAAGGATGAPGPEGTPGSKPADPRQASTCPPTSPRTLETDPAREVVERT